jgi:hypothetical protein
MERGCSLPCSEVPVTGPGGSMSIFRCLGPVRFVRRAIVAEGGETLQPQRTQEHKRIQKILSNFSVPTQRLYAKWGY